MKRMDTVLFIKKVKEICKNNACKDCPLWPNDERAFLSCTQFMLEAPEEIVEEVEKWAKEHPGVTRMSEFISEHPNAEVGKYKKEKFIDICPQKIDNKFKCRIEGYSTAYSGNCFDCKIEYWNEEAEE